MGRFLPSWRARVAFLLALTLGSAAQAEPLQAALTRLGTHPALQAAQARVRAAEAQLRAAGGLYSARVEAGYVSRTLVDPLPSERALRIAADVSLTPIQFGDNADTLARARLAAQAALLDLRQTFTTLNLQAYRLTYQLAAAQQEQQAAVNTEIAARASLEAIRSQLGQGQVSQAQARRAEATYRDLQEQVRDSAENVALFQAALTELLGTSDVQAGLPVRLQPRSSPDSVRAMLAVNQAAIGLRAAQRALLPVASVTYTRTFNDQGSLGLSLNSRTLAPSLSISATTAPLKELGGPVRSALNLGVTFDASPARSDALTAAEESLRAAQASFSAQQRADALRVTVLGTALDQAERTLRRHEQDSADAQQKLHETRASEGFGEGGPLDTLGAVVAAGEAEQSLRQARLTYLTGLLDLYQFADQPVTETSP